MKLREILLGAGLVLGAGLSSQATGCTVETDPVGIALLGSVYPDAAGLLEAEGELIERAPGHFVLRPRLSRDAAPAPSSAPARTSRWRTSVRDSDVTVRVEGGQVELSLAAGGKPVRVRRALPAATRASVDGERAVLEAAGDVHAVFVPLERGVEELVVLRDERAVRYDFALPVGWSLREARGYVGLVEVLDDKDRAQARMRAALAWDAEGREVPVEVDVAERSVTLSVTPDAPGPVLLDPAWEDGGTVVQVRRNATTALLPSGRVLITGGATAVGAAAVGTTELYDPQSATFTAGPPMQATPDAPAEARVYHVAAVLPSGRVLIAGGLTEDLPIGNHTKPASVQGAALSSALIYDVTTDAFTAAQPMGQARSRFTATVLPDGRVLVAGGTSQSNTFSTAEVFDPSTGAFDAVGTMSSPRHEHAATLVHVGASAQVLVTGGSDGTAAVGSVDLFDPASGSFTPVSSDLTATPRYGHVSVLLPDGRVLVAGGKAQVPLDDAHLFDPTAASFSFAGQMSSARFRSSAVATPQGDILLAGGLNDDLGGIVEFPISSVEVFDLESSSFEALDESPFLTQSPSLHPLPDGSVLLTGLTSAAQILDVLELEPVDPLAWPPATATARVQATATLLPSGSVWVAGGFDSFESSVLPPQTFFYLPTYEGEPAPDNAFEPGPDLHHPRSLHTATVLLDGRVLVAGGGLSEVFLDSAEIFDPIAGTITDLGVAAMNSLRAGHTATLLSDGRVLLVGGLLDPYTATASAELFDPSTETFTSVGEMAETRAYHTAAMLPDGRVLIAGGSASYFDETYSTTTEIFDIASGAFSPGPTMGEGRAFHVAAELPGGGILVAGGAPAGSVEILSPDASAFAFVTATKPRFGASLTRLTTGHLLLAGGHSGLGPQSELSSIEVFNPASQTWNLLADGTGATVSLGEPRRDQTATLLADGRVAIVGGAYYDLAWNEQTMKMEPVNVPRSTIEIVGEILPAIVADSRPDLDEVPPLAVPAQTYEILGTSLDGAGDAGGSSFGSGSRPPIALWLPNNGPPEYGTFTQWSSTSADWRVPAPRYPGPGLLFAVTNGVRSLGHRVVLPPAVEGIACTTDGQCATGHCVDGVCCDTPCDDLCSACTASLKGSGEDGVCEPIGLGLDPQDECTSLAECPSETGTCNGAAACQLCSVPPQCDGDHTIVAEDESTKDCSPYKCTTDNDQCLAACTKTEHCAGGFVCTAKGTCEPPFADDPLAAGCGGSCAVGSSGDEPPVWLAALLFALAVTRRAARRGRAHEARAC